VADTVAAGSLPFAPGFNSTTASATESPNATHGDIQRNQPEILDMRAPASIWKMYRRV
jgi:hypothetical protein